MTHAVFLCDKNWIITRCLHHSPDLAIPEGAGLFSLLTEDSERPQETDTFTSVTLRLSPEGPRLSGMVSRYPKAWLVMAALADDIQSSRMFNTLCAQCLAWAAENLQELYTDDYYQIQQMNNQLINSQRALSKSNQQLKQALAQVQEANSTIESLEHDVLTGLLRAPGFFRRVEQSIKAAPDAPFDIIVLDIANFTLLCEVLGNKVARKLLQETALYLLGLDTAGQGWFCRARSDLFYIYMPARARFPQVLQEKLPAFFESYPLPIHLHGMVGVYSAERDDGSTPFQMCERAQLALHTLLGRDDARIAFYDRTMQEQLLRQHKLLDSVPDALHNHQFLLYLQPKIDMFTGETVGAEGLVRWRHPELGFVPPDDFIPLLEQEDMIYPVDQYVWDAACQFLARRRELNLPELPVSVNVARRDLYRDDLAEVLDGLLKKYDLEPRLLRLEILERAYTEDSGRIVYNILSRLREKGFLIEMDDFGTGASTLSMAADMPIDVLKLDRGFLAQVPQSPRHTEIVRFVVQLARTLDLRLVCEGVETAEQVDALCKLGCRYAQGYYYSRPRPAEAFLKKN